MRAGTDERKGPIELMLRAAAAIGDATMQEELQNCCDMARLFVGLDE